MKTMIKSNSVIKQINTNKPVSSHDIRLHRLFGEKLPKNPYVYRHKESGEEYGFIVGASWLPEKITPGFIVIVGVRETDEDAPDFFVLDEWESHNIGHLLKICVELREKWGYCECAELFRPWHGEYERYYSIIDRFNADLIRTRGRNHGFYPTPPVILEEKNAFSICARQIFSLLEKGSSGKKRLHIGNCVLLRNYLVQLRKNNPRDWKSEHYPSLMALGLAIHVLLESTPWRIASGSEPAMISFDSYVARSEAHTMKQFGQDDYDFEADGEHWSLRDDFAYDEQ